MRTIHRAIVSALLISKDGKLLMGMKDPASGGVYADAWHIPGGGINDGESKLAALRREVREETGIDITAAQVALADDTGSGQAVKTLESGETVLCDMTFNVFRVDLTAQAADIALQPADDLVRLEWVELSKLGARKLTPPSANLFARLGWV